MRETCFEPTHCKKRSCASYQVACFILQIRVSLRSFYKKNKQLLGYVKHFLIQYLLYRHQQLNKLTLLLSEFPSFYFTYTSTGHYTKSMVHDNNNNDWSSMVSVEYIMSFVISSRTWKPTISQVCEVYDTDQ